MALFDGKSKNYSGGNVQREAFNARAGKMEAEPKAKGGPVAESADGGEPTTQITHHADGSKTAVHSDGETSEHPHSGHLAMHLHAKHEDGEALHAHKHMDGVTTHHVGMDGQVQGPHEHASAEEAGEHMKSMLGDGGGANGAEENGMAEHLPTGRSQQGGLTGENLY